MQENLHITNEEAAKTVNIHVTYQYSIIHKPLHYWKMYSSLISPRTKATTM
jgi:hypothetical protein